MTASAPPVRRWFVAGDLNGFFGLVVDNLSILGFIAAALIGIFQFPAEVVFTRMFPGTAFGVLVGNLIYTWMAHRLAAKTGRDDVTAMPLGLDAPTSIGMALLVLGPAFVAFKQQGLDPQAAAIATWQLGMASLIVMGLLKLVLSFFGDAVTRMVPRAGLLGSIGGAALTLLGFLPLIETLRRPSSASSPSACCCTCWWPRAPAGEDSGRAAGFHRRHDAVLRARASPGWARRASQRRRRCRWRFTLPLPTLGFLDGLRPRCPICPCCCRLVC